MLDEILNIKIATGKKEFYQCELELYEEESANNHYVKLVLKKSEGAIVFMQIIILRHWKS